MIAQNLTTPDDCPIETNTCLDDIPLYRFYQGCEFCHLFDQKTNQCVVKQNESL